MGGLRGTSNEPVSTSGGGGGALPRENGLTPATACAAAVRVTTPARASATHREKNIPSDILHEAPARARHRGQDLRRIFDALGQSLRRPEARMRSKNTNRFMKLR